MHAHPITRTGAGIAMVTIAAAAVVSGVLIHNPHASAQEGDAVDVALADFSIDPAATTEVAGHVTFVVSNGGLGEHEFLVARTDLAADALPLTAGGAEVDEAQLDVVARIEPFAAGDTHSVTANLDPGAYVLVRNLPGHYELGMRVSFSVTAPPPESQAPPPPPAEPPGPTADLLSEGDGGGLPAAAWFGLALMFVLGGALILLALAYLRPQAREPDEAQH